MALTDGRLDLVMALLLDGLLHDGRGDLLVYGRVVMTGLVPNITRRRLLSPCVPTSFGQSQRWSGHITHMNSLTAALAFSMVIDDGKCKRGGLLEKLLLS